METTVWCRTCDSIGGDTSMTIAPGPYSIRQLSFPFLARVVEQAKPWTLICTTAPHFRSNRPACRSRPVREAYRRPSMRILRVSISPCVAGHDVTRTTSYRYRGCVRCLLARELLAEELCSVMKPRAYPCCHTCVVLAFRKICMGLLRERQQWYCSTACSGHLFICVPLLKSVHWTVRGSRRPTHHRQGRSV